MVGEVSGDICGGSSAGVPHMMLHELRNDARDAPGLAMLGLGLHDGLA